MGGGRIGLIAVSGLRVSDDRLRRSGVTRPDRSAPPAPRDLAHLRPQDARGLTFLALSLALTGAGLWLSARGGVAGWLIGQLALAVAFVRWFVLLHECGHETLFRTKWLHAWAGQLAGFFAIIPFRCWKRVHGRHHKWTGWQDVDPTTVSLVPRPLGRLERTVVNFAWKHWVPLFSIIYRLDNYWNLGRLRRLFPDPREWRGLAANAGLLLAAYAGLIALAGPATIARLAGLAVLLSLLVEDPLLLSQHTHIPQGRSHGAAVRPVPAVAQEVFTRSLRFPSWVSRWVLLNLDAHELHHMYPFVPAYHLRRIAYATRNEMHWWGWLRAAKRLPGEVFLFQNRTQSGLEI